MAVKNQHIIPNFILKEWGFDFDSNDSRIFSYYLMRLPTEKIEKINTKDKSNDPVITEYIYEEKSSCEDGIALKFNEIESQILQKIETRFGLIKEKIINNRTVTISLTPIENYTIKIFMLISWLRSRHNLDGYIWIKKNADKILHFQNIENIEGIKIVYDKKELNNWKLEQLKLIKAVFNIFENLISSEEITIKEGKIKDIFNKILSENLFDKILYTNPTNWEENNDIDNFTKLVMKFNFDRDFFYKVWSKYSELDGQKPFRIICEKLHFFQNSHSFIKNFIFQSNLNFIINDNKNFFLPDSMVTQFLDLQMGLNTLSFMPISPKFGIIVVNSVWSYKFTNNSWTELEEKFYTSIERQTDLFKSLYIDNSSILINNQQFKESELIWQPKNDEFSIALGIDSTKDLAVLLKNNINLIIYQCLLNLELEFFYLNEFGSAYSNNFLILPTSYF